MNGISSYNRKVTMNSTCTLVTLSVVMVLVVRSGGSSAGETDSSGYTALHYAARAGHGDIVTVGPVILSCRGGGDDSQSGI